MRIRHRKRALCSLLRQYSLISAAALLAISSAATSDAGPLVIEESAKLTSPDPSYELNSIVAVGGNSAIVGASRPAPNPEFPDQFEVAAFLFERSSSGTWAFVGKLTEFRSNNEALGGVPNRDFSVAMNSLVAGVIFGELRVFERTAAGWVSVPASGGAQNGDLEVHSGLILAGSIAGTCSDGTLFQKQAGTWSFVRDFVRTVPPDVERCGDIDPEGGDVDVTSNRVIVSDDGEVVFGEERSGNVQIWNRNTDGSWPVAATAVVPLPGPLFNPPVPSTNSGRLVTIEGDDAIANSASPLRGPHVLRLDGAWTVVGNLQRPDRAMLGEPTGLELLNGFAAVGYPARFASSSETGSVGIFRRNANGNFEYAAKFVPSDGEVGANPEISGRRVITAGRDTTGAEVAYIFDLPADFAQPALIQDDFEDRNLAEWTPIAGSVASVVSNGLSFFYRQTSVAGEAGATRTGLDMKNQSIEADVVIRSFAPGGERWAGLSVRETSPGNYYYLTLRNNSVLSLRKLENGAIRVLSSVTLPINLTSRHKLRLEAIGRRIRGYVDGQLRVQARDTTHKHGTAGIRMFKTAADYDNVVISPNPQTTLLSDDFEPQGAVHEPWWNQRLGIWSETADGSVVFAQTSLTEPGRVTTDIEADDQVVQVRAKATQFAPGDPWFGLVSRLQDDGNFYYLTVRGSNTVSLRRLQNGQITVLDSAALPVSVGTWYTLRLEAIGSSLRGYVNDRPLVEARDTTFTEGTYGLATSRATAHFDNFRVTQP